jgi:hypothetical protein
MAENALDNLYFDYKLSGDRALVDHARGLGYWVRFYILDGFAPGEGLGWGDYYNVAVIR